jgi:hypothetical protein
MEWDSLDYVYCIIPHIYVNIKCLLIHFIVMSYFFSTMRWHFARWFHRQNQNITIQTWRGWIPLFDRRDYLSIPGSSLCWRRSVSLFLLDSLSYAVLPFCEIIVFFSLAVPTDSYFLLMSGPCVSFVVLSSLLVFVDLLILLGVWGAN